MNPDDPKAFITNESFDRKLTAALKKQSVEIGVAIMVAIDKLLEDVATKKDIQRLEHRIDGLEAKMDREFTNVKRDINDLKADTPTQKEVDEIKRKVGIRTIA